jgi:hypothetical protein
VRRLRLNVTFYVQFASSLRPTASE